MDEARRAARPGAKRPGKASKTEVRVDRRALAVVALAAILAAPAVLGLKAVQDRKGRSALLAEAIRQRDEARRPDLALGYFNRYLELAPDDLDALDRRADLLASSARDGGGLDAAIRAHVGLLGRAGAKAPRPVRKRLASLYLRSGQFRAAEQVARDLLAGGSGDVEARRLLARALEGSGRMGDARALEEAAAEYEAAEALEPGDVASGERLAALYLDKFGDRARAWRVLDALPERNPRSSPARLARARAFAASGDAEAAGREVDEAVRLAPGDVDARIAAASLASRRGDPAAARGHLAAIDPPRPDDLRVKVVAGQVELDAGRPDLAIGDWRAGLALTGGTDADLTWRLAHVLIQLGRAREAAPLVSQFRRLTGGDEPSPPCRYLIGLAALKSGRVAEALAEFEAIRDKPSWGLDGAFYLALGQAHEAANDPVKAAEAYARAATAADGGPAPWLALARLQGGPERVATLERGIAAVGPQGRLLAELAGTLWREQVARPATSRDWSELDRVLARGEQVAPGSVELAMVRADRELSAGRPEGVLAALRGAVAASPAAPEPRLALAGALDRLGRREEALAGLEAAVAEAGDRADFRVARARMLEAGGRPSLADSALEDDAGQVPPDQRAALAGARGEARLRRGDRPGARRAFLEWASLAPGAVEPHLALLDLAIAAGDAAAVAFEVDALKAVGGLASPYWRIARAEALLRDPAAGPAALEEAARLGLEVEAMAPGQPAAALIEGRLMERRGSLDAAVSAYRKAVDRKGGALAVAPLAALLAKLGRLDELEALRSKLGGFPPEVERALAPPPPAKARDAEALSSLLLEGDPIGLGPAAWRALPAEPEESLRAKAEANPEGPAGWLRLLMAQVARKDREGALATLGRMAASAKVDRPALLRANAARAAGLRDLADPALLDALRSFPDDAATLRSAADHYEETGRPALAEPPLRKLAEAGRGPDWAGRRLAMNLAARGGGGPPWREALALVGEGSASTSADDPEARLARGVVLALGPAPGRREGVAILDRLAAELPDNPKVEEALARALIGVGDLAAAREHASRAARAAGAPPDALRLAGSLDLAAGDLDAASVEVDRLAALGLDDPATLELSARLLKARGRSAEAVATLEKILDGAGRPPGSVEAGRAVIGLLTSMGEPEGAERVARRVAGLGPFGAVVLAEWLNSRGRLDEAARAYDAASADPRGAREAARSALAMASADREPRRIALADRLLDRAVGGGPLDDDLAYARASLRHLQGRLEEAVALYDDLAGRSPSNVEFLNNGAWILSEDLGRPRDALARIDALASRAGAGPHALDTRGVIFLRLGETARAVADLEAAAALAPSGPICYHLARALLAAGRRDDAARALAKGRAAGLKPESLQPSERAEFARVASALK